MKLLKQLSVITLVSLLAVGCGGGSKSDDNTKKGDGGIQIGGGNGGGGNTGGGLPSGGGNTGGGLPGGGNTGGGNGGGGLPGGGNTGGGNGGYTPPDIAGVWVSPCLRGSSGKGYKFAYSFDVSEGTPIYLKIKGIYTSGNSCAQNEAPENTILYGGAVQYNGTTPTSVCTANNFDVVYSYLKVNNNEYTEQKLKSFLSENGDNGTATGIACGLNGKLALSESEPNSTARPNDVNQNFYFTKVNSKFINGTTLQEKLMNALNAK